MKKKLILLILLISCLSFAQVGVGTNTPTASLDVNGNTRVRNLTGALSSDSTLYPNSVVVTTANGTLTNTNALNILYASGIYRWSDSNNNWSNIRTGGKEARLDFTGRSSLPGIPAIVFSILYQVGSSITIIQNPVLSAGTATITSITATGFTLTVTTPSSSPQSFTFTLATVSGITSINAGNSTGTSWIQGTWHSTPNLN